VKTSANHLAAWTKKYSQVSESTLALTFAENYGEQWRYNTDEGMWLQWVGTHWARGNTPEFLNALRNFLMIFALAFRQAQRITVSEAVKLQSQRTLAAVERMCRALPSFLARASEFDADPFLLGTPGGTVDLKTGDLWVAEPGDMITMLTKVTPAPRGTPCPEWIAFLMRVMDNDPDLMRTMQQWAGISATGSTRDQRLMFIYGVGRNGKGVYCRVISGLLGAHAAGAPRDLFVEQGNYKRHPTELVRVVMARMVLASEVPEGAAWDVALIKEITGGDDMEVRRMRENLFKIKPSCTITIVGNLKPELKSVDEAVRGRFLVVTFPVFIPEAERIADYEQVLIEKEGPAILRWIIDGAVDRETSGALHVAKVIKKDTEDYFEEENIMVDFIRHNFETPKPGTTVVAKEWRVETVVAYELWRAFCARFGRKAGARNPFTTAMKAAGIKYDRTKGERYFTNIRIRLTPIEDEPEGVTQ